ncbi:MAG: hypothetical protein K8T89_07030 [Planctomycetes bacterium]|nr:hypothetical protein [Planctomycetota bacterium]
MLRPILVILAICSLSLSGCGTFSDVLAGPFDDRVYYRGVRMDIEAAKEGGAMTLMAADIPFSAVADTILIPFIVYAEMNDPERKILRDKWRKKRLGQSEEVNLEKADPLPPTNAKITSNLTAPE